MQSLNLPPFDHKVKLLAKGYFIFDTIRKKYVRLTPEEWVRQHLVHYLIDHLGYRSAMMSLERGIRCKHGLIHRPDIVIYDLDFNPFVLVECKTPELPLDSSVLEQIARYNAHLGAPLLVVSNGMESFCWKLNKESGGYTLLPQVPSFGS